MLLYQLSNVISLAKSALKSAPLHQLVLLIADAIHRVESHLRKDFAQISASPSSPDWSVLLDETRPKIAVEVYTLKDKRAEGEDEKRREREKRSRIVEENDGEA